MGRVIVKPYDEAWPAIFAELRADLREVLEDIALAIEHVGSTSVPGLVAKPVIDIDIVVSPASVSLAIERLAARGYEHLGDLGIPQREAFRNPPETPRHNLYVCPEDSPALANHLAVRDYLRTHAAAAREYGTLKMGLARQFAEDIDSYIEGKTDFLLGILRKLDFTDEMIADIERMNRKDSR